MATINRTFETQATADEMKSFVSTKLLPNPALASMLDSAIWQGNVLLVNSKLGKGTITLQDRLVIVNFELTFFGSVAKNAIESTLEKEFKQLKGR